MAPSDDDLKRGRRAAARRGREERAIRKRARAAARASPDLVRRRLESRRTWGPDAVVLFILTAPDRIRREALPLLTLPERRALELETRRRQARNEARRLEEKRQEEWRELQRRRDQEAEARAWSELEERIRTASAEGRDPARIAAASGYTQRELDKILSEEHQTRCRQLRKTALWGIKVREALGCSRGELDRWDRDGRLPHLLTTRLHAAPGQKRGRKWALEDVEAARAYLENWRTQDDVRRRFARRGLRVA